MAAFGTTGEGTSFSANERLLATERLLKSGFAPERIVLGVGFPAVEATIALARAALSIGLTHVLILPPYFYRDAPPEGIEDAFSAIFDGVADTRLRATLYHIPQVSGVAVPALVAARLRARYGAMVAGVKDSSADFAQFQAFRAASPDLAILVGNEPDIGRALSEGGAGTICGLGNIVPELVRTMFTDRSAGAEIREVIALFEGRSFVPTLKAILAAQTKDPAWLNVKAPLRPGSIAEGESLLEILAALRGREAA